MRGFTLALAALLAATGAAQARTLRVGPAQKLTLPSQAVAQAQDGDTILIDPGTYFDCVAPRAAHLTIAGANPAAGPAVLTDRTCDGKALVVADGDDMLLRDLVLQRARVPDGNGAGIRAEARNLTVERVRFVNDQAGIIAADVPGSALTVTDSFFSDDGACDGPRCIDVVNVGKIALLRIAGSTITASRGGHAVVSAATATVLDHDSITDGPAGAASFQLVLAAGGSLTMQDCVLEKGPHAGTTRAAVLLQGRITGKLLFRNDRFDNHTGTAMPFVLNWTNADPDVTGLTLGAGDWPVSTRGAWLHVLRQDYVGLKDGARHWVGGAVRKVRGWFR
jgi:hypothetical protein